MHVANVICIANTWRGTERSEGSKQVVLVALMQGCFCACWGLWGIPSQRLSVWVGQAAGFGYKSSPVKK